MDLTTWFGFLGVALFVTFTPGPAVLMAIANSLSHGAARAMIGSLGNAVGLLVVSAATTAGLGVLLHTSATAFLVLKVAGACYLVYLGIRQWRQASAPVLPAAAVDDASDARPAMVVEPIGGWRLFGRGLTVALTNPKAILFFTALFPQFLNDPAHAMRDFAILTLTFSGCAMLAHAFYASAAHGLRRQLGLPGIARWLNRVFGACFVALGVSLLGLRGRAI